MDLKGWDQRYSSFPDSGPPTPLLLEIARGLTPGKALDLACGAGRNARWLADHGWDVTAVDGSQVAVDLVSRDSRITAVCADLERGEYALGDSCWDFIAVCYYLQRDLFAPVRRAVRPGGVALVIVHLAEPGAKPAPFRLPPGELLHYFDGWEILHSYEGRPRDPEHQRLVAEVAARRPV